EDFLFQSRTDDGELDSVNGTDNDLFGAQIGTDLAICLTPRLRVAAEVEAGLYGMRALNTTVVSGPNLTTLVERIKDEDVAFVSEAGVTALYRATPRLTFRGGYQLLFLDGVALATENFNTASPFVLRETFVDTDGDVFYHGVTGGLEWTW